MAAENVIRKDIIQVDFDSKSATSALNKLQEEVDKLKKALGVDLGDSADKAADSLDDMKKAANGFGKSDGIKKAADDAKKLSSEAGKASKNVKDVGNQDLHKLRNGLDKVKTKLTAVAKKAASISFKALTAGISAASVAVGALVKQAVSSYGETEQLIGGVKTIFGTKEMGIEEYAKSVGKSVDQVKDKYKSLQNAEKTVIKNANDAYKTAGLSANDYMSTVTSFSASLLQGLNGDTEKAAEKANTAIIDMSDNANKMGTDMTSIQYAYQGFAKQNYTIKSNSRAA